MAHFKRKKIGFALCTLLFFTRATILHAFFGFETAKNMGSAFLSTGTKTITDLLLRTIFIHYAKKLMKPAPINPVEKVDLKIDYEGTIPEEIHILLDQLQNPKKYQAFDASPTKGILLYGPPGTGKTHLARYLAYKAKVPFFAISATSLQEKYQGEGAKKVVTLFNNTENEIIRQNKQSGIIFIDEIDVLGNRNLSYKEDNSRFDVLAALLTQMDGFDRRQVTITTIAATNQPNTIDPALKNRFSHHIKIPIPDKEQREKIAQAYINKYKKIANDVTAQKIAENTEGLNTRDIVYIFNTAACQACHKNQTSITWNNIHAAIQAKQKTIKD